ncbi:glutamine-dependent NAD(+) synthetase isoform X1 [Hydra vulgaris]|uniref:glutamine-dependent NAD(+) synthetase isoform X1 n=1 Tax=Hydra vulgaris TaxID=6087 RepID=UPI0006415C5A|nr:glutamine-dependent NAD(+) synthetase [Hydra vulgaris]
MQRKVTLATCSLAQWSMDFEGNLRRILESIRLAKEQGARYRLGPELEIPGYGCNDHFSESDTLLHSWESLACILENTVCENLIVDVGMPVLYNHALYNCRVIFLNKRIILIRPKKTLAIDENYRESRWFTPWIKDYEYEELMLPPIITKITGQVKVPFGEAIIVARDTVLGCEVCQELFSPQSPHLNMALQGVEIVTNGSASNFELQKMSRRIKLISDATSKLGGVYLYSAIKGCDGERLYYDGPCMIFKNGELVGQGKQFSLNEVEVVSSTIDLEEVSLYRRSSQFGTKTSLSQKYPRLDIDFCLCVTNSFFAPLSPVIDPVIYQPEEEIALGPACWLWDYLRRSGMGGFFLPLSGGVDSSATACIVASMCRLVCDAIKQGSLQTISDIQDIVKDSTYIPTDPKELCNRIFVTCYMGTENSSAQTRERAKALANDIGSYHLGIVIDTAIQAILSIFSAVTKKTPRFSVFGGSNTENLALQNVQARVRMVTSYLFAQLTLWSRGKQGGLLVLGSANVDECLLGYMTKYDCSSADINPIGGISKTDLKKFVFYCVEKFNFTSLIGILGAPPTAELTPLDEGRLQQTDEGDIGLTYEEISILGRLRKLQRCGPYSMFTKLLSQWNISPSAIADKVKLFFTKYAINRHKMTTITPSLYAVGYSPDDNRYDLRPFLYRSSWPWQFKSIDRAVKAAGQSVTNNMTSSANQQSTFKLQLQDGENASIGYHDSEELKIKKVKLEDDR